MDWYDKLKLNGIVISGCIDSLSRYTLRLKMTDMIFQI